MSESLEPRQVQDLPWASLDDLIEAKADVEIYGRCWAEVVSVDGDLRLKRLRSGVVVGP